MRGQYSVLIKMSSTDEVLNIPMCGSHFCVIVCTILTKAHPVQCTRSEENITVAFGKTRSSDIVGQLAGDVKHCVPGVFHIIKSLRSGSIVVL